MLKIGHCRELWVKDWLKIGHCHELWCRIQTQLGSCVATVAMAQTSGYSSDWAKKRQKTKDQKKKEKEKYTKNVFNYDKVHD